MSNLQKIKEKRNEDLGKIIVELSDKEVLDDNHKELYVSRFKKIYVKLPDKKPFRHSYAIIYSNLAFCNRKGAANLDLINANLKSIVDFAYIKHSEKDDKWIIEYIEKLYDHISLDSQRINYQKVIDEGIEKNTDDISKRVGGLDAQQKSIENKNKTISEKFEKYDTYVKKMENAQTDVISVMGVFTAIVLAFVGGMAFSTSVLENIHRSSIYRLMFVMSILGIVLINLIWGLLSVIKYINENIKAIRLPFIIANIVLVLLLLFSFGTYEKDYFNRENKLNERLNAIIDKESNTYKSDETINNIISETKREQNEKTKDTDKSKDSDK